jgi:hypothetical protein
MIEYDVNILFQDFIFGMEPTVSYKPEGTCTCLGTGTLISTDFFT